MVNSLEEFGVVSKLAYTLKRLAHKGKKLAQENGGMMEKDREKWVRTLHFSLLHHVNAHKRIFRSGNGE